MGRNEPPGWGAVYADNTTHKAGVEGGRRGPRKHLLEGKGAGKLSWGVAGGRSPGFLENARVLLVLGRLEVGKAPWVRGCHLPPCPRASPEGTGGCEVDWV